MAIENTLEVLPQYAQGHLRSFDSRSLWVAAFCSGFSGCSQSANRTQVSIMHTYKPPEIRYAVRIEDNGTWTVFDTFTDQPAEIGGRLTTEMRMSDAEEIKDVLNFIHPANDNGTIH